KIILLSMLLGLLNADLAAAFPTQDDQTPGMLALHYRKKSNWWLRLDAAVVDGKVTTSPPDLEKLDRRLETFTMAGFDSNFNRWGLRLNVKAESSTRRQAEKDPPKAQVDATIVTMRPSIDITFETDKGLEIFFGREMK